MLAGNYRATVSPAAEDTMIGHWDICLDLGREILLALPLIGTGGMARDAQAEFSIASGLSPSAVEVRVYYDGVAARCFRELVIEAMG